MSKIKFLFGFIILSLFFISFISADLNNGIYSYYKFEGTSNPVQDSLGINNGTVTSGVLRGKTGIINNSFYFRGELAPPSMTTTSGNQTGNFSINFWIKRGEGGDSVAERFINGYGAGGNGFVMGMQDFGSGKNILVYDSTITGGSQQFIDSGFVPKNDTWYMITYVFNGTEQLYVNGVKNASSSYYRNLTGAGLYWGSESAGGTRNYEGYMDEIGIWNRSIDSSEIVSLYNSGAGNTYPFSESGVTITLDSPISGSVLTTNGEYFNASYSVAVYNFTNSTYYLYKDGSLFNKTVYFFSGNNSIENSSQFIDDFTIGDYIWNVQACYQNDIVSSNCLWSNNGNFTFSVGASLNNLIYEPNVYETSYQTFIANFSVLSGAEVSLMNLVYDGISYPISNFSTVGNNLILSKSINIPLNSNQFQNQTNSLFFQFNYNGGSQQNSSTYQQNSSFINLQICNATYSTQALNFTLFDESSQTYLNTSVNKSSVAASFNYWLGTGSIYKNYSFENLSSVVNSYQFCISPYNSNISFKTDMQMDFSALSYVDNSYYLKNASLSNVSSNILLYLLPSSQATKFYLTFQLGIAQIQNAIITVQKYFVGDGTYKTVSIKETDGEGKIPIYLDLDAQYRYTVVQNGEVLGVIDKTATCASTPCESTLIILASQGNILNSYYDTYAQGTASSITYNSTSKIVTYNFLDLTGLANYFRLEVTKVSNNVTRETICNTYSYSAAGTITCNMTGYTGDFIAKGYISRSPEKVDGILAFIVEDSIVQDLGLDGLFLSLVIIVTLVFATAIISRGNPSAVIFIFGITILGLKLAALLPFNWITVSSVEALIFWILTKIQT